MPAQAARILLVIAYCSFISLGLPDAIIGVAWPSVRETFGLSQASLGLVFVLGGAGYFLSSFFAGQVLRKIGVGMLLAGSSALVALAACGYATAPVWIAFAGFAAMHGLGSGAIDAGLNHYAAEHFSARHMNWLHACYSLGAMLGPLIMTTLLVRTGGWRSGYGVVAGILAALTILFIFTRRRWGAPEQPAPESAPPLRLSATLLLPAAWLQIAIFFFYTGLEVAIGQWSFTLLTESRAVSPKNAGLWVTFYWGSIAVGRVLFGFLVETIGIDRLLRLSLCAVLAGAGLFAAHLTPWLDLLSLIAMGLALAPIYPCLMTRTPTRLGKAHAAHAIGVQVSAAMLGAALLPSAVGLLAENFGLEKITVALVAMAFALCVLHETLLARRPMAHA